MRLKVERLRFEFLDGWNVSKYDDWSFYRNQFGTMWSGIKAVDVIAISPQRSVYFIEVKDYRLSYDEKPSQLPQTIAEKVLHTLAAQIPCKLNANEPLEQAASRLACRATSMKVILHLEQPVGKQGIFRPYDPSLIQQKLRQLIKPIDPHPLVASRAKMHSLPWSVASLKLSMAI